AAAILPDDPNVPSAVRVTDPWVRPWPDARATPRPVRRPRRRRSDRREDAVMDRVTVGHTVPRNSTVAAEPEPHAGAGRHARRVQRRALRRAGGATGRTQGERAAAASGSRQGC